MSWLFPEMAPSVAQAVQDAASDEWFTPRWFLAWLPPIRLDPCASPHSNVAAANVLDVRAGHDGLTQAWSVPESGDGIVFVNPPYSDCARWVEKCAAIAATAAIPIVALVPGYAGDQYWHRAVWGKAQWVGFIAGRIRFDTANGPGKDSASFTSAMVCWGDREAADRVLSHVLAERKRLMEPRGLWVVNAQNSMVQL